MRARDNIEILIRVVLGAPQCNDLRCELERSLAFVPAKCCILGHNASHYLARGLLLLQANRGNVGESEEKLESPSFLGSSKAILKRMMLLSLLSLSSSTMTTTGTMPKMALTPERMTPSTSLPLSLSTTTMTGAAAKKEEEKAVARRTAVDKTREKTRGGGVNATTSRQTRKRARRWRQGG